MIHVFVVVVVHFISFISFKINKMDFPCYPAHSMFIVHEMYTIAIIINVLLYVKSIRLLYVMRYHRQNMETVCSRSNRNEKRETKKLIVNFQL